MLNWEPDWEKLRKREKEDERKSLIYDTISLVLIIFVLALLYWAFER